jgi:hypothetical protein
VRALHIRLVGILEKMLYASFVRAAERLRESVRMRASE